MTALERPDWGRMLVPDQSLIDSFLRGCFVYVTLVILFRIVLKRQSGGVCVTDVMLAVLVSECVSSALTAETRSIPNGLAAVLGLLVSNYAADWGQYKWSWFRRLTESTSVELVRDGRLLPENLEAERIGEEELYTQLREKGVDDLSCVKSAIIESDGKISVIERTSQSVPNPIPAGPPDLAAVVRQLAAATEQLHAALASHEARAAEPHTEGS